MTEKVVIVVVVILVVVVVGQLKFTSYMCEILESTPAGGLHLPAVLAWSSSSSSSGSREIDSDNVDKCQMCLGWEETGILLFVGLPPLLDSLLCINKLCGFRRISA